MRFNSAIFATCKDLLGCIIEYLFELNRCSISSELLEVQNAELELKKSKLQVITEEYTYVTSLLDLEYALNASVEELGVVK